MARFLVRRILQGLLVIWLVTIAAFLLFALDPSGPDSVARRIGGRSATPAQLHRIIEDLGLREHIWNQYWHFLVGGVPGRHGLIRGDLGHDYYYGIPVTHVLKTAAPVTLSLAVGAAVLWLLMGLASGVLSAVRPRSFLDRFFTSIALFFYSLPTFVLGLLLLLIFYFDLTTKAHLHWFPAAGYVDLTKNPAQWAHHLLLPWLTLAVVSAAAYTRLARSSMLDVLGEDYIRTARAKGLSERRVVLRHGLRAALTPIVTQFGIDVAVLIGGAVVTETVFSLHGLGYEAVQAINNQDLPVIIGIVIVASVAVVVANIVVDIFYAILDPRVRLN
ncbi:MAG TPA: ABC transporter permease [Mycobacteriales bacterium]|jgi:peptide/nickel transport system permease protein|nr:ABC transporter permease [Mycobacteriales bacterium]